MSELVNKLNSINLPKVAQLTSGSSKTVGDLWNDVIFNLLPDKDVVLRWHKVLMEYVERPDAMFAIRGYNTEPIERYGRLRRGFLTSTNRDYSFFYTDNFHATYFLKMAMDGFVPTVNELLEAYNSRRFPARFGPDTSEEREMMAMPSGKDPGIQVAGYKVAHIYNVGTDYMCGQQRLSLIKDIVDVYYPRGEREDWKWVSDHTGEHYERRLEVSASARPYLVAAFLRFVHPFNYFLVPKKNAATVDVSENKCLIGFVKSMFRKLYGAAYDEFERKIMVQANDGVICSETYPLNISYGCGIMQYNRVAAAPQQKNGVPQTQRMAFKELLRESGYAEGTANSYASGVNTSSRFARERLDRDIDAEYEVESEVLSAYRGRNIAICNQPHAWYCIRESRIRYAAKKGFDWIFILRRTDETSKLGGYARIYRCPAQELLSLIESNILGLAAGGHCLYIKYNSGAMYADVNCRDRVHQFLPVKYKELNSLIRRVPTDSQLP